MTSFFRTAPPPPPPRAAAIPAPAPMLGVYGRNLNKWMGTVKVPTKPMICKLSSRSSSSFSSLNNWHGAFAEFDPLSLKGAALSTSLNHLTKTKRHILPARRTTGALVVRASGSVPYGLHHSQTTDKPKWWQRTLACIPYLMPLHFVSMYAEFASKYIPLMSDLEILTDPFTGNQLPIWFSMIYFSAAYFGVVRNKKCPYFFRFHLVMAMLFENAIQIIGTASSWFPYARYWGDPFWTVVAFVFYFAVLECMRNALQGLYPDIPFFSLAACAHAR